jgi:polysaccharide export outer membrane protein
MLTGWRRASLWALALLAGCSSSPEARIPSGFTPPPPRPAPATPDALKLFEGPAGDEDYRLGEGDGLLIHVWEREDLSGEHVVGPDGRVTMPFVGPLKVAGLTRAESATAVKEALSKFYANAVVSVRVQAYASNHVVVLGRVQTPGAISFPSRPTLLEALARAGGVARDATGTLPALTHCSIIRGRDKVAWVDLGKLLESGDPSLNVRLRAGDVVFVPEWEDLPVYVLGQVERPGPIRWTPGLSILDAVAKAGGLNRDAAAGSITIIRPSSGDRFTLAQSDLFRAQANAQLQKGDVVFVPTSLLADVGYVFEKINPFGWVFLATTVR